MINLDFNLIKDEFCQWHEVQQALFIKQSKTANRNASLAKLIKADRAKAERFIKLTDEQLDDIIASVPAIDYDRAGKWKSHNPFQVL